MTWFQTKLNSRLLKLGLLTMVLGLVWFGLNLDEVKAASGINSQLNYQGKLNTSVGNAVTDSSWNFRFRIYNASTNGNLLWTERWTSTSTQVTTVNGVFSVALGSISSLSGVDFNNDSLYLQVDLDANTNGTWEEEFSTRKRLTATPYAFNADLIDGIHATSTAAVANQLLALDSYGNLNLFNQGVSSTFATTSWLYVREGALIKMLNATTTNVDNLAVFKTGVFTWLSATTSLDYWFNASSTLASGLSQWYYPWAGTIAPTSSVGIFVNASSTINADFRVNGNATTSGSVMLSTDDGGVGIGYLVPGPTDGFQLTIYDGSGVGDAAMIMDVVDNQWYVGVHDSDDDKLKIGLGKNISLNTFATFQTNGYLGIGTGSPLATFNVSGTILLAGNASTTGTLVVNGQTGYSGWISPTNTLTVVGSGLFTGNATTSGNFTANNALYIKDSSVSIGTSTTTDLFRVGTSTQSSMLVVDDQNGFVGIGTASPGQALEVVGLSQFTRSGHSTYINPNYEVGDVYAQIQTDLAIALATGGDNNRLYITSTGNVGIGTTAPAATLNVSGTTLLGGAASTTGTLVVNATANSGTWKTPTNTLTVVGSGLFTGNATTSGNFTANNALYIKDGSVSIGTSTTTDLFRVGTSTQSSMLVVDDQNGYVGIGTTAPTRPLMVSGSVMAYKGTAFVFADPATMDFLVTNSAGDSRFLLGQSTSYYGGLNWHYNATASLAYLSMGLGDASTINLIQGGNVGIGVATPVALLHVAGTTLLGGAASTTGTLVVNGQTSYSGWASPTNTLTVVGSGLFTGNATTSGNFTANNALYVKDSSVSIGTNTTTDLFRVGTSTQSSMLVIDDQTGFVGIGTASPSAPLDVQGNIFINANDIVPNNAIEISLTDAGSGNNKIVWSYLSIANTSGPAIDSEKTSATAADLMFDVTNADIQTELMRLDGSALSVGIGLNSPTSTLSVLGTADIRGNATTTGNLVVGTGTTVGWGIPTNTLTVAGSGLFTGNATTSGHFEANSALYVKDSKVGIRTISPDVTLDLTIADDVANDGLTIQNSDGYFKFWNGDATVDEFLPWMVVASKGDNASIQIRGIESATAAAGTPTFDFMAANNTNNGARAAGDLLFRIRNWTTSLFEFDADGDFQMDGDLLVDDDATITDTLVVGTTARTATGTVLYGGMLVDDTTLVVNANEDRVGIGTATPGATLEVKKAVADYVTPLTILTNDGGTDGIWRLYPQGDGAGGFISFNGSVTTNTNGTLVSDSSTITGDHVSRKVGVFQYVGGTTDSTARFEFLTASAGANAVLGSRMVITHGGNVGIDITAPGQKLDVIGNASSSLAIYAGTNMYVGQASAADDDYLYFDAGNESFSWDDSPGEFDLSDDLNVTGNATTSGTISALLDTGGATANVTYTAVGSVNLLKKTSSLRKYKTDIDYNGVSPDLVYNLQPVSYTWIGTGAKYYGFIAEDVALVDSRFGTWENGEVVNVEWNGIISALTSAAQAQKLEINKLASDLAILQGTKTPAAATSLTVVDNPDLNIQTLVVQQAATFYGTLYVQGEAGFMHKVVFEQDIEVKGKIYASADQAGTAVIKAGATSTEVVFGSEYEVVPKVVANLTEGDDNTFANWKVVRKSTTGFSIILQSIADKDLTFDWIALAVKGQGEPPVINDFVTSLDTVGLDIPVELWAQVTDPDTQESDLTYSWKFEPNLGKVDGNTGLVYWIVNNGVSQDTDVTVTVTVSDGSHRVSQSKVVKVLAPPKEDNTIVRGLPAGQAGCTDQSALNYNSEATEDDGSCQFEIAQTPTTTEPIITLGCTDQLALNYDSLANQDDGLCEYPEPIVQEPTSTTTEPVAQGEGDGGVGGPPESEASGEI